MKILAPRPLGRVPRVSVVVPHYNYGRYLPDAVRSALDQAGVDLEVIIVDDHSTDGSREVARRLAAEDGRIRLIEHERNLRHIRTYNDGLSQATGDYVVLLSADDALAPDSLTRAVALMEAHPTVGLVYGSVQWFDGALPEVSPTRAWWQIWSGSDWVRRVARRGRNAIVSPEAVMRRSVYADIGGYDPAAPHAGDMFMWLQAAARADVGFVGGPRQAFYRDHGGNMHTLDYGGVLDDMTHVRDVYRRYFATDGARMPDAATLNRVAMRSLAREALLRAVSLRNEGAPPDVMAAFLAFAQETSPTAARSLVWRWATFANRPDARAARTVALAERARWTMRSRRTDLIGL
ncbi:glycosyltransferase family 2 protein [Microbacterium sp. 179-B 1A2 NHS]|uniref:glycosyltransferase family 2 protein n=1 Tax=Microbacterium sp. 179-B 1A2 NHS TaxID=3142383 RepID=UPI0039A1483F